MIANGTGEPTGLRRRVTFQDAADLQDVVDRLIEHLENQAGAAPHPVAAR
jgi:hypothetical protein